jgi:VanZ family protein
MNFWKKHFTDPENKHLGWMFIPQNWYAGDKQQHTLRGLFWSISFFIMKHGFDVDNLKAMLYSFLIVATVGIGNELYQKYFTKKREPSIYDAMADIFGWVLLVAIASQLFPLIF